MHYKALDTRLFLILLFCPFLAYSQIWNVSMKGERDFNDVCYTNEKTVYAVHSMYDSEDGVLKSTDGGKTWTSTKVKERVHLKNIYFFNQKVGFVVGSSGIILKTIDEGKTWNRVHFMPDDTKDKTLNSIHFADASTGCAVGGDGLMLRTADGGKTWNTVNLTKSEASSLYRVQFVNNKIGYAAGLKGVIKTMDGGKTWEKTASHSSGSLSVYGMQFLNNNTGYIAGSFGISKTTDGGKTWEKTNLQTSYTLYDIYFFNVSEGYAVGDSGFIVYTKDGGNTWNEQKTSGGFVRELYAIHFTNAQTGMIVGYRGIILTFSASK